MQAVALSLLGYSPDAQDAVQDAMLVALQRLDDLRDPSAAGAWFRAVARNACRMRLRAARPTFASDPLDATIVSGEPSPEELLDRHALRDWVWYSLEHLSEPLRLVVMLRYFSDVSSYEQIAAICDVPVGTVRSRLNQARQKLSASLLATAASAHDDAGALTARRRQEAEDLLSAAEHGRFGTAIEDSWSADVAVSGLPGLEGRGRVVLVRGMEADYNDGVRQRLGHVTASRDLTILECDLLSPTWNPEHCPAGVVWLLSLREDQVVRARLFHPQPAANHAAEAARIELP
jgi:RNA polymerase sigma-70 factor (ECF subfamily)